jgi:sRNA-binding carbon storage regulator CsrA
VDGGQVRVAFDAPKDVKILREELLDQPPDEEPGVSSRIVASAF